MTKIYNKELISELDVDLFYRNYKVVVLDNPKYDTYDVHIITNHYAKDELNTLFLQEPKDVVSKDKFDEVYLTMTAAKFALWDELYGYKGKNYAFNIEVTDEYEL